MDELSPKRQHEFSCNNIAPFALCALELWFPVMNSEPCRNGGVWSSHLGLEAWGAVCRSNHPGAVGLSFEGSTFNLFVGHLGRLFLPYGRMAVV